MNLKGLQDESPPVSAASSSPGPDTLASGERSQLSGRPPRQGGHLRRWRAPRGPALVGPPCVPSSGTEDFGPASERASELGGGRTGDERGTRSGARHGPLGTDRGCPVVQEADEESPQMPGADGELLRPVVNVAGNGSELDRPVVARRPGRIGPSAASPARTASRTASIPAPEDGHRAAGSASPEKFRKAREIPVS